MSKLSGFIATCNGEPVFSSLNSNEVSTTLHNEEIFTITWKKFLEIDNFIQHFCLDNHLVKNNSRGKDIKLDFINYAAFKTLCLALKDKIGNNLTEQDLLTCNAENSDYQWYCIIDKIFEFLDLHTDSYFDKVYFKFFSYN